ncbi:prephenate dehydrogenase [Corynebacterium sp. ES2794-CONJ1]|uniref:prephenate dehydrogenase n=1 Tax=unclassified Corynebacterium TaxID=2624378 RepID=UPI002168E5CD|nr:MULTISPECIES: prephenate dehydrogenase [unclassified Corynebacterium]MCS4490368.1 prephenate dehydrogenase [Corynebacterium sp. ES2775-CONJ]MCS4532370.1 prephenate dehydrogenase [Corynebacterium sp. ES2730-CONJ]MCU9519667.1 prephenate dehydrogenase [Corynebacterium sp. ES2794-CONJ1]
MSINQISRPVCILGLGLIGGSLMRALHEHGVDVFGHNRSPSATRKARAEGFDVTTDLTEALSRAAESNALIVLATPMPAVASLLDALNEYAPHCGFTDVVSVKGEVYALVKSRNMQDRYVGGHPMAGTAESGWDASFPELFRRAVWVVTFDHLVDSTEVSRTWKRLWIDVVHMATLVGAEVVPARVHAHDLAVARVSHLPHILAEALAIVGDNGGALALSLAAGSFRDATRVAGTSPSLVRSMCETNHLALGEALDECLSILRDARAHLSPPQAEIQDLVDSGYRSRVRFEARSGLNASQSVSPAKISNRPVFRLHHDGTDWANQLIQAENLGARIEVL